MVEELAAGAPVCDSAPGEAAVGEVAVCELEACGLAPLSSLVAGGCVLLELELLLLAGGWAAPEAGG